MAPLSPSVRLLLPTPPIISVEDEMVRSIQQMAISLANRTENRDRRGHEKAAAATAAAAAAGIADMSSILMDDCDASTGSGEEDGEVVAKELIYQGHEEDYATEAAADEHDRLFRRLSRTLGVGVAERGEETRRPPNGDEVQTKRVELLKELAELDSSMDAVQHTWAARATEQQREHDESSSRQIRRQFETATTWGQMSDKELLENRGRRTGAS
jgi:hypothetical protein